MKMKNINKDICIVVGYNIYNYATTPDKYTLHVPWFHKLGLNPWNEYNIFQKPKDVVKNYIALSLYTGLTEEDINTFGNSDIEATTTNYGDGLHTMHKCAIEYEDFKNVYSKLITLESLLFGEDPVYIVDC